MNKPIVNVEAKWFLMAFAVGGLLLGIYTLLGRGILESDGFDLTSFGGRVLLIASVVAIVTAFGALLTISDGRVGGWWILGSWLSTVAWFGLGHLFI